MLYKIFSLTTLFRFINFAAFAGLVVYLFNRYLLPSVRKQIHEKKLLLQNLETQKQGLKYQLSNLDQALEQQNFLAQELNHKIALWAHHVSTINEQNLQEQIANQAKIDKRTKIKNEKLTFELLNKKLIPSIITRVEHDLTQKFNQEDHTKKYIDTILRFIEESSQ